MFAQSSRRHLAVRLIGWYAALGVHAECSATAVKKFFGGTLRCGRSADTFLWVHTPIVPAAVAQKFLGDFKGDFFKKPPLARLLYGVSFHSFSLRLHLQRKTAMESDKAKERGTLRHGRRKPPSGRGVAPSGDRGRARN